MARRYGFYVLSDKSNISRVSAANESGVGKLGLMQKLHDMKFTRQRQA